MNQSLAGRRNPPAFNGDKDDVYPPGENRAIAGDAMPNRQAKQKEKDDA